jgi:NitT/TauT family transport system substrate-binding protein
MRFTTLIAAAALAAVFVVPGFAEPLNIRIGWVVVPPELTPVLFQKSGVARHYGSSYVLEPSRFQASTRIVTALAGGELDIAPLTFSTLAALVLNARMDDIRIIADEFQDGADDYYTTPYLVRKDGPVKMIEDLKGRVVATNGIGSSIDMGLRVMLKRHNLEDKRDYTTVEVGFPNMKAMLGDGKADLVMVPAVFAYDPALRDMSRLLFTQKEALGKSDMVVWSARAGFLAKNRAAVTDFLEDALRSLTWYSDPAHHDEAVEIIAQFTKIPAERLSWVFTKKDQYRDPGLRPDVDALHRNMQTQLELGFIKQPIDVKRYVDLSLLDEASRRAKR